MQRDPVVEAVRASKALEREPAG